MHEKTLTSTYIYKGKILNLRKDKVLLKNKLTTHREIVEHSAAVVIFALDEHQIIHLVQQYRKPVEATVLEVPAGCIDLNEEPLAAAQRELKEETGFEAQEWHYLGKSYPSPGFTNELFHFYLALKLKRFKTNPDEDEILNQFSLSFSEMKEYILSGKITDAKTIISFYLAQEKLKKHA
jgi:ADP-ribose pyrophosphatase